MTESDYINSSELSHRKKYAQYFTPDFISDFMAGWLMDGEAKRSVLEPAFGLGIFSRSILRITPEVNITAYDIDEKILTAAKDNLRNAHIGNITLTKQDYITSPWEDRYDAIICNPPYFKFHDYNNDELVPIVNKHLNSKLSLFTNIYPLFLMKSISQLNEGGRCAYIIPSEFLNSDYGVEVKRYLLKLNVQLHFIVIDFEQNVFNDATTTACIVLCQNKPSQGHVRFSYVKRIEELNESLSKYNTIDSESINPELKWKNYYTQPNAKKFRHLVNFSYYAKVSRGIATGDNNFFTFNKAKAAKFSIPDKALQKCVCHSTDIEKTIFTSEDFDRLSEQNKSMYIFKGAGNEDEEEVQSYINIGEANEANRRYLCVQRKPWYSLEKRTPAPIWVSVFNRKGLKFIRNEAGVSNLTTFHCVYINSLFVDTDIFFAYLLTDMAYHIFLDNSRQYGNGLVKFEPNDINKSKVVDFDILSEDDKKEIKKLYGSYKINEEKTYVKQIEDIFLRVYGTLTH